MLVCLAELFINYFGSFRASSSAWEEDNTVTVRGKALHLGFTAQSPSFQKRSWELSFRPDFKMNRWLIFAACAVLVSIASAKPKCGKCDKNSCEKAPKECPAGIVKDPCGCCDVCGNLEGDLCDHPEVDLPNFVGNCGHKLECKVRNDVEEGKEAVCVCSNEQALCGDDGVTYSSICKLMETVVTSDKKIKIKSKGPCKRGNKITQILVFYLQ